MSYQEKEKTRDEDPVVVAPKKLSLHLLDFTTADTVVAIIMTTTAVILWIIYGFAAFTLGAVIGLLVLLRGRSGYFGMGRIYFVVYCLLVSLWIRRFNDGYLYRTGDGKKRKRVVIPLSVYSIIGGGIDIALGYNSREDTDSVIVTGSGADFRSGGPQSQHNSQMELARMSINLAAAQPDFAVGLTWVLRSDPNDLRELNSFSMKGVHPDIYLPESRIVPADQRDSLSREELVDEMLNRNMREMRDLATGMSSVWKAGVVTIKRSRDIRTSALQGSLAKDRLHHQPIIDIADMAREELESCGVNDTEIMDTASMHRFFRGAWDVVDSQQADDYSANGNGSHWPKQYIRVTDSRCYIDGSEHAVLRVTTEPDRLPPDFWWRLFDFQVPGCWVSRAVCGEVVSAKTEQWLLNRLIPSKKSLDVSYGKVHWSSKERKRDQDREIRERTIEDSGGASQVYNILISLSGREGSDAVEKGIHKAQSIARSMRGVKLEQIRGEYWQLPALLSARTGLNLL